MAINIIAMALMPISQCIAWYLVVKQRSTPTTDPTSTNAGTDISSFYNIISGIACFYCVWALYNRYLGGVTQELGQYSMGALTICAYFQKHAPTTLATGLVLVNFLVVVPLVLIKFFKPSELAKAFKNDSSILGIVWAIVLKAYFISNLALWSFVLYQLLYKFEASETLGISFDSDTTKLPEL